MAEHGVDGVFLQRFAGQCDMDAGNEGIRRIRDEVGRARAGGGRAGGPGCSRSCTPFVSRRTGHAESIARRYDVSGVAPDRLRKILERDWAHLVRDQGVLDSPNYLKEKGRPVVALWGASLPSLAFWRLSD